jgi:hypothetical protein
MKIKPKFITRIFGNGDTDVKVEELLMLSDDHSATSDLITAAGFTMSEVAAILSSVSEGKGALVPNEQEIQAMTIDSPELKSDGTPEEQFFTLDQVRQALNPDGSTQDTRTESIKKRMSELKKKFARNINYKDNYRRCFYHNRYINFSDLTNGLRRIK